MKAEEKPQPPRRLLLWRRDPRCFWCGRVTRIEAEQSAPDLATKDHLHRKGQREGRALPSCVLACLECNSGRGQPKPPTETCPVLKLARAG